MTINPKETPEKTIDFPLSARLAQGAQRRATPIQLQFAIEYISFDSILNWRVHMSKLGSFMLVLAAMAAPGTNAAWAGGTGHRAVLVTPTQQQRVVAHGLLWQCAADHCTASPSNSRPLIACQALAREAGPVARFSTGEESLAAEQLARCNSASERKQTADAR